MNSRLVSLFALLFAGLACCSLAAEPLKLHTRRQIETAPKSGQWQAQEKTVEWDAKKTAIVICDMWDQHWCKGATERVGEMATRMNEVVKAARAKGILIIHAPSSTMKFYEGTPQRKRAQNAPAANPPVPLKGWCNLDLTKESALPIDDSDGGCDDNPQCKQGSPWTRQIATIEIAEQDAITDSSEAYNLLQERGIENVIVMGVHANMCVLGRPFSIRQMVGEGKNVLLMRDMTDTMYNSRRRPFVSHFRGTDLIVGHVERFWCPSITSVDFLGGEPFRFSKDPENPKYKRAATETYVRPGEAGPLSPEDSARSFTIAEDLQIEQVLAEPDVRQPLHLSWDDRGRLWVVQYIQYPAPAGLTLISKDQFWRAVYDKVPPPPPHHFKGEDRITIHEDTDGDGKFDRHKTFIEGLSIVTAVEHGGGGHWVLNPPYLLFFSDTNHDDVVDSDPVVHLTGFGLEDTHSVANSLRWGPDGWLYGAHGSTVTANIVRPGLDDKPIARIMGQAIWRYHPKTRRFEVFAEGGGNAFGVEMDDQARIFSGHNGGNTRGFHYVQGGYLQKGFEKHGPLSNPYAFGYFKQMENNNTERFTHTFVIYGGGALPERYNGQLFGVEPLQGRVVLSDVLRDRSSFKTHDLGYPVTTTDRYFRPVEIKVGPDGAIYVADWYDRQVTHTHNYEGNIDKSNGRVYRIKAKNPASAPALPIFGGDKPAIGSLLQLGSPNRWVRQNALREIASESPESKATLGPKLKKQAIENTGQYALECFWAFNLCAPLDDESALEFLRHRDPHVRAWTVRLLGDRNQVTHQISDALQSMAEREPHVEVRSQLASTAKRLPASDALPIVKALLTHNEDASDIHIPLLLWWAVESKAESDRDAVLALLKDAAFWKHEIVRTTITDRLMRRYALAGTQKDLRTCAQILQLAVQNGEGKRLLASFEDAMKGRPLSAVPRELDEALAAAGGASLPLAIRRGDSESIAKAIEVIGHQGKSPAARAELIQVFGEVKTPAALPPLLRLVRIEKNAVVRRAAVAALQIYDDASIPAALLYVIGNVPADLELAAYNVLVSREPWADTLRKAVESGKIERKSVPAEIVEKLRSFPELTASVDSIWGVRQTLTNQVLDEKIHHFSGIIQGGKGDPFAGYNYFNLMCGTCHTLFGEGGKIGPDLTVYKRDDLATMLMNIVNPSGEIREGYENVLVETKDGRSLSGFIAEKYDDALVLRALDGAKTLVANSEIVSSKTTGASIMPEGLLEALEEQQVRDLFAYLRSTQPLVKQR